MTSQLALSMSFAQNKGSGGIASLLPLFVLFGVFYFLLIRPQQKKTRAHKELVGELKQGDRVVAAGGVLGTIRRIDEDVVSLQVADNVVIKVDRATVVRKVENA